MTARIRHNDYSTLPLPKLGDWEPRLSVSVVIPAYGGQEKLDLTLAALAAQTYPGHLLEVVVVDDGSTPPLRLPEIVPERVRLIRSDGPKWGRAHACHTGAAHAEGEIVHWLDSDMVVYDDHVEAQLRWHHLAGYLVVLGYKRFVDFTPGQLTAREVYDAVAGGSAGKLFDYDKSQRHEWVEDMIDSSDGLRRHGSRSFRAHVGATASLPAALLRAAGGMDDSLVLGEDSDLGFRLAQEGAVFVPDPQARSWHLGPSTTMRQGELVKRHNEPYLSQRMPLHRSWRGGSGRQWKVPCVEVVIDATGRPYEQVRTEVGAALAGDLPDATVTLLGPWSSLTDERRSPLSDPLLDLRLIHTAFGHDGRVTFAEQLAETSEPTPFRLVCPPGWTLTFNALRSLWRLAERKDYGLIQLALPAGADLAVARFERTAAVKRALAVREEGEKLDDVIDELYTSHWLDGSESAMVATGEAPEAPKRSEDLAYWKSQAEHWEAQAARLKAKLQQPVSSKLRDAARRRVSRLRRRGQ